MIENPITTNTAEGTLEPALAANFSPTETADLSPADHQKLAACQRRAEIVREVREALGLKPHEYGKLLGWADSRPIESLESTPDLRPGLRDNVTIKTLDILLQSWANSAIRDSDPVKRELFAAARNEIINCRLVGLEDSGIRVIFRLRLELGTKAFEELAGPTYNETNIKARRYCSIIEPLEVRNLLIKLNLLPVAATLDQTLAENHLAEVLDVYPREMQKHLTRPMKVSSLLALLQAGGIKTELRSLSSGEQGLTLPDAEARALVGGNFVSQARLLPTLQQFFEARWPSEQEKKSWEPRLQQIFDGWEACYQAELNQSTRFLSRFTELRLAQGLTYSDFNLAICGRQAKVTEAVRGAVEDTQISSEYPSALLACIVGRTLAEVAELIDLRRAELRQKLTRRGAADQAPTQSQIELAVWGLKPDDLATHVIFQGLPRNEIDHLVRYSDSVHLSQDKIRDAIESIGKQLTRGAIERWVQTLEFSSPTNFIRAQIAAYGGLEPVAERANRQERGLKALIPTAEKPVPDNTISRPEYADLLQKLCGLEPTEAFGRRLEAFWRDSTAKYYAGKAKVAEKNQTDIGIVLDCLIRDVARNLADFCARSTPEILNGASILSSRLGQIRTGQPIRDVKGADVLEARVDELLEQVSVLSVATQTKPDLREEVIHQSRARFVRCVLKTGAIESALQSWMEYESQDQVTGPLITRLKTLGSRQLDALIEPPAIKDLSFGQLLERKFALTRSQAADGTLRFYQPPENSEDASALFELMQRLPGVQFTQLIQALAKSSEAPESPPNAVISPDEVLFRPAKRVEKHGPSSDGTKPINQVASFEPVLPDTISAIVQRMNQRKIFPELSAARIDVALTEPQDSTPSADRSSHRRTVRASRESKLHELPEPAKNDNLDSNQTAPTLPALSPKAAGDIVLLEIANEQAAVTASSITVEPVSAAPSEQAPETSLGKSKAEIFSSQSLAIDIAEPQVRPLKDSESVPKLLLLALSLSGYVPPETALIGLKKLTQLFQGRDLRLEFGASVIKRYLSEAARASASANLTGAEVVALWDLMTESVQALNYTEPSKLALREKMQQIGTLITAGSEGQAADLFNEVLRAALKCRETNRLASCYRLPTDSCHLEQIGKLIALLCYSELWRSR